ncbi:MAG: hypothetical protein DRQ62_00095 [Gammaproteobacteria bacterium]|nr:MAG: hypothetical protein DRQ62_00095 [Gammaproteobacteria bacterium]
MNGVLVNSIKSRIDTEIAPQSPLKYLKSLDIEECILNVISVVYLYTRTKKGMHKNVTYLTEVISAIGHGLRNRQGLKRDSSIAAKTGAFFLYSFEELGMIEVVLSRGTKKHNVYVINVLDDDKLAKLWESLPASKIEKLPKSKPYAAWSGAKHECGMSLIKTGNKGVLEKVNLEDHPIIFDCVNKAQQVGWRVNEEVYDISVWALRNKADAFSDIWDQHNPQARATKLREAKAVGMIAKKFIDTTFYHLYYYDFRGRKYPSTAYLHEQGADLARGLLLREDKKAIGKDGFFWLLVSIASNWAGDAGREDGVKTDKIPLEARSKWVLDNEEIILSYAESPKVNQGWMKADKPWQFIAACIELANFRIWQMQKEASYMMSYDKYGYESHLECFIDG